MNRIFYIVSWVTLALAAVLVLTIGYLLFVDGNPPVEIETPVQVDKEVYEQGDTIWMTVNYCRYVDATATIYSAYVSDAIRVNVPAEVTNTLTGCGETMIRETIPADLPPGIYSRVSRGVYEVNVLAHRTVDWYTEEFEVIEKGE